MRNANLAQNKSLLAYLALRSHFGDRLLGITSGLFFGVREGLCHYLLASPPSSVPPFYFYPRARSLVIYLSKIKPDTTPPSLTLSHGHPSSSKLCALSTRPRCDTYATPLMRRGVLYHALHHIDKKWHLQHLQGTYVSGCPSRR